MLCGGARGRREKAREEWFRAACTGDIRAVTKLLSKHNTAPSDARPTLAHGSIFSGFAAIHYAAYNGHDAIVKLLLRTEATACTEKPLRISALGIINSRLHIHLSPGATPLMVAVIRGHIDVALTLLEHAYKHEASHAQMAGAPLSARSKVKAGSNRALPPKNEVRKHTLRAQTATGISALMLLVTLNTSDAITLLKAKDYLLLREEVELTSSNGGNAALMIALLGRDKILEEIISLILGPEEYYTDANSCAPNTTMQLFIGGLQIVGPLPPFQQDRNLFYFAISFMKSLMQRDERGFTVLDSARYQLNEKKWGTSRAAKERTYLLYRNLLWRIHIFVNDCPPVNIQNPCEHWNNYEACCNRLGAISDGEFKILAKDLAKNPEINHSIEDMLTIPRFQKLMRPFSSAIASSRPRVKAVVEPEVVAEHEPNHEPERDSYPESIKICPGASIFDSSIEPSSTLNSTLVLTKTVVGDCLDDQTGSPLQTSIPVRVQDGIELAQVTPTTKSHRSDKFSVRSSNSLQLSLNLNFDASPTSSSQILNN